MTPRQNDAQSTLRELPAVPPELVRDQVQKILVSSAFANADRLRRFLRFVVDQTLRGRAGDIKEYLIGTEVFDRDETFDPRADSVVRVEARSLRAKLAEYYASEGQRDSVIIDLPKGHYAPVFRHREQLEGARRKAPWIAAAIVVLAAAGSFSIWRLRQAQSPITSIAVLPFLDLNADPKLEYLGDGLVEDITTELGKVRALRVAARTSAFQFKKGGDARQIGQQLKVGSVLEGSVRRTGAKIRVTAQLIGTSDGYHLWSESYDVDLKDAAAVQMQIARSVLTALRVHAQGQIGAGLAAGSEAHDLYWRARYVRRKDGRAKSVPYFEQAIRAEPGFAPAHAALASTLAEMAFHGEGPLEELIVKARTEARKALELDETTAEAHVALAFMAYFYDRDWAGAEREFHRALALNPSYAYAHQALAIGLLTRARLDDAVRELKQARELDPLSSVVANDMATVLYCARRCDEAVGEARRTLAADPKYVPAHLILGGCHCIEGNHAGAIAEFQEVVRLDGPVPIALGHLGFAYAASGQRDEANRLLKQIAGSNQVAMAYIYAGLGDKAQAIAWLEKANDRHETNTNFLAVDPLFSSLAAEPRFLALKRKIGLP